MGTRRTGGKSAANHVFKPPQNLEAWPWLRSSFHVRVPQ
jgi:hypothetical protein